MSLVNVIFRKPSITRDVTRSDVSCKIRLVSRKRDDFLAKYFAMFTLELHNSTDTRDVKRVLKTFKSAFILLHAADLERATQTVFLITHYYFCVTDI